MERKTFASKLEKSTSKIYAYHLRVPAEVTAHFLTSGSRRVWCSLAGDQPYQCALTPIGSGVYVLTINKVRREKYSLEEGTSIDVELFADDSTYGLPMPEELAELMRQDSEGDRLFHALTPGKLRTLLYIVNQGKDSDDRLRRAVVVIDHLRTSGGKIDYTRLHAEL